MKKILHKSIYGIAISIFTICLFAIPAFAKDFYCPTCRQIISGYDNLGFAKTAHTRIYANHTNVRNITDADRKESERFADMSDDERQKFSVISRNLFFVSMINEIFSLEDENLTSDSEIFNTKKLMLSFSEITINAVSSWGNTSLYWLFVGLGFFILFTNFIISFYNNRLNSEAKTYEQYTRMVFELVIGIFIIVNVNNIVVGLLNIFKYTMERAWSFMDSSSNPLRLNLASSGLVLTNAEEIAYTLLEEQSPTGISLSYVADVVSGGATTSFLLTFKFFLPWLIAIIGKYGILFAVIKCSLEIVVNCMLYPIAAGDCSENLKQSKFMRYTKHIIASVLQLTIIVLILMASQFLTGEYAIKLIEEAKASTSGDKLFNVALIAAVIQLSKMIVITTTSSAIAQKVVGE